MGWDWFYVGNRLQETPQPDQILGKQPISVAGTLAQYFSVVHLVQVITVFTVTLVGLGSVGLGFL